MLLQVCCKELHGSSKNKEPYTQSVSCSNLLLTTQPNSPHCFGDWSSVQCLETGWEAQEPLSLPSVTTCLHCPCVRCEAASLLLQKTQLRVITQVLIWVEKALSAVFSQLCPEPRERMCRISECLNKINARELQPGISSCCSGVSTWECVNKSWQLIPWQV